MTMTQTYPTPLKKELVERGIKAAHVARKAGITPVAFGRYANGFRKPPVDVAQRIAEVMQVPLETLFPLEPTEAAVAESAS